MLGREKPIFTVHPQNEDAENLTNRLRFQRGDDGVAFWQGRLILQFNRRPFGWGFYYCFPAVPHLRALCEGSELCVKEVYDDIWLVSFMDYDLGYFDLETRVLEALENPFGPKLLPMS